MGLGIRHELGHQAQSVLHRFNQTGFGFSYKLGDGVDGHGDDTCEWGDPNMIESLATFFGVRSVTAGERNVWACGSNDNANMDACSEQVPLLSRNADRVRNFTTGRIWGIGDNFATGPLHCARITAGVNGCPACSGAGCTDYYQKMGFRVEINTVRYLWDIVDTSSDDDLSETTDESVNSLAALMEGMPCARSGLWGVDGTCRESRRTTEGAVVPVSEVGPPVSPMGATRDSYNQWDFGDLIPGSQAAARSKNCVNLATD
jgi:hypothetical protein